MDSFPNNNPSSNNFSSSFLYNESSTSRSLHILYSKLHQKLTSIKSEYPYQNETYSFFSIFNLTSQTDYISFNDFRTSLNNLGITDSDTISHIMSKFRHPSNATISLVNLKSEYESYLKRDDISNLQVYDNITDKIINDEPEPRSLKLCKLYLKIKSKQTPSQLALNSLYTKFQDEDKDNSGEVDQYTFDEVLKTVVVLTEEEKALLYEECKNVFSNRMQYKKLTDNIKNANEDEVNVMQREFNKTNHSLVVAIRTKAASAGLNMNDIWAKEFNGETNVNGEQFKTMIKKYNGVFQLNDNQIQNVVDIMVNDHQSVSYDEYTKSFVNGKDKRMSVMLQQSQLQQDNNNFGSSSNNNNGLQNSNFFDGTNFSRTNNMQLSNQLQQSTFFQQSNNNNNQVQQSKYFNTNGFVNMNNNNNNLQQSTYFNNNNNNSNLYGSNNFNNSLQQSTYFNNNNNNNNINNSQHNFNNSNFPGNNNSNININPFESINNNNNSHIGINNNGSQIKPNPSQQQQLQQTQSEFQEPEVIQSSIQQPEQTEQQQQQQQQQQYIPEPEPEEPPFYPHPFTKVRSKENFDEISRTVDQYLQTNIINSRIHKIKTKLNDILFHHEYYTVCYYYSLINNTFRYCDNKPRSHFMQHTKHGSDKLTQSKFALVLNTFNISIPPHTLSALLNTLTHKTSTLYSYEEFLHKVTNYFISEDYKQSLLIHRVCSLQFDDYIYDFKHFIIDNGVKYESHLVKACSNTSLLNLEMFIKFCKSMNYRLSHEMEYKYLFDSLLEKQGRNATLSKTLLFNIIQSKFITQEDFINSGKVKREDYSNEFKWKEKIIVFNDENDSLAKSKKYEYDKCKEEIIKIRKQLDNEGVKDIAAFFDDVNDEIEPNEAEIPVAVFKKKIESIKIQSKFQLQALINKFKSKNGNVKLAEFVTVYLLFKNEELKSGSDNKQQQQQQQQKQREEEIRQQQQQRQEEMQRQQQQQQMQRHQKTNTDNTERSSVDKEIPPRKTRHDFSKEDLDQYGSIFQDFGNLIVDEKLTTLEEFFNSLDADKDGYIALESFHNFIKSEYDEESLPKIAKIYECLIEENKKDGIDIIDCDYLIYLIKLYSDNPKIQKVFPQSKKNIQSVQLETFLDDEQQQHPQQQLQQPKELSKEDKLLRDYSLFIFSNKKPFNTIYPNIHDNTTLNSFDFTNGFKLADFPITNENIKLLLNYFDPVYKESIPIEQLKHEITKYTPTYFNEPFQTKQHVDNTSQRVQQKKQTQKDISATLTNKLAISGLNKITQHLRERATPVSHYFNKLNTPSNPNAQIYPSDFAATLGDIPALTNEEINHIFNIIDYENKGTITYTQLIEYFGNKDDNNISAGSKVTQAQLKAKIQSQIEQSFNEIDSDNNTMISKDDFIKTIKYSNTNANDNNVEQYLINYTQQFTSNIDKQTYCNVQSQLINELLLIKAENKDILISTLKSLDYDNNNLLTQKQVEYALETKLKVNIAQDELSRAISAAQTDKDDLIDIDKFANTLYSNDNIIGDDLQRTLMNIKEDIIIPNTVYKSVYSIAPLMFKPSFIREYQRKHQLLASKYLTPNTYADGSTYVAIKQVSTAVNTKIYLDNAIGVPMPNEKLLTQFNEQIVIVGRQVKMALFDTNEGKFVSNTLAVNAKTKKGQDRWNFETDRTNFNNNVIIRYQPNKTISNIDNAIELIFEFILLIKLNTNSTNTANSSNLTETSLGWCSCPIKDLYKSQEKKMEMKGGTPFHSESLSAQLTKSKSQGFTKILSNNEKSLLTIKIKHFNDLDNDDKKYIDYLPITCIFPRISMQMVYIYRKIISECITNRNNKNNKNKYSNMNFIVNSFGKICDSPDTFRNVVELWNEIVVEGATSADRKNEEYFKKYFYEFVNKVYSVMFTEKYMYEHTNATCEYCGENEIAEIRKRLINAIVRCDKPAKHNKVKYGFVEEISKFKPFSIGEVSGRQLGMSSKMGI